MTLTVGVTTAVFAHCVGSLWLVGAAIDAILDFMACVAFFDSISFANGHAGEQLSHLDSGLLEDTRDRNHCLRLTSNLLFEMDICRIHQGGMDGKIRLAGLFSPYILPDAL